MKLDELLTVLRNGETMHVFVWDTRQELYTGGNFESNEKLAALKDRTVLYVSATDYMTDSIILEVGVK